MRLTLQILVEIAGGDTRKELLKALDNVETLEQGRTRFSEQLQGLREKKLEAIFRDRIDFYVANRFSVSEKTSLVLKKFYNATVTTAEFDYPDIALADQLNFEGNWKFPLELAPFGENLMETTAPLYYLESKLFDSKIVRLPYKNGRFAMLVFLPNDPNGVDKIFEQFTTINVQTEMIHLDEETVRLLMPKFISNFKVELKDFYMKNGVKRVFMAENADLRALIRSESPVAVSSVVQMVNFVVDEGDKTSRQDEQEDIENRFGSNVKDFNVNRPFVYMVEDELTGEIIIAGKQLV